MKKSTIISLSIILILILSGVICYHLPFEIRYRSAINFGNELIVNIENYRKENNSIPETNDDKILETLGFESEMSFLPQYHKINTTDYMLLYCWGFDPPWLYYYSKTKEWDYGFDYPKPEKYLEK